MSGNNVIEKDLLSHILKLETGQQKLVLKFVKDLLDKQQLEQMANDSEIAISEGRIMTIDDFKSEADKWIQNKTATR